MASLRNRKALKGINKTLSEKADRIEQIWAVAEKDDRALEEEERDEVHQLTKAIRELKQQKAEVEANIALEEEVKEASNAFGGDVEPERSDVRVVNEPPPQPKSLGEQFTESKSYKQMLGSGVPSGTWKTEPVELNTKATVLSGGTLSGYGGYQQNLPGVVPIADQPLVVSDLMPQNTATAPQIQYFKERVATNAAAGVAEGNEKPESAFDFEAATASLTKIATFLPVSDEMLEDAPSIQAYLNSRLAGFIRTEEEQQLLRGAGSGSNEVEGFIDNYALNGVGTATVTGAPGTASFGDFVQIMNNQRGSSYLDPDAWIMHPTQFGSILAAYDSNGQYYAGGPLSPGAYGGGRQVNSSRFSVFSFFNVPVHVTTQVGAGTLLLGNFSQGAAVWRRGGVSVQASNAHDDYFKRNLTAIRAEERLALTIYRPEAFTVVTW